MNYVAESVRVIDLVPGMKIALHRQDNTIVPYSTVDRIETQRDGSVDIHLRDDRGAYTRNESADRIANDSTIQIAVEA